MHWPIEVRADARAVIDAYLAPYLRDHNIRQKIAPRWADGVLTILEPAVSELIDALRDCYRLLDMLDPNCRAYDEAERVLARWTAKEDTDA